MTQRTSTSRPDRGLGDFAVVVLNQHGDVIQRETKTLLVARRIND